MANNAATIEIDRLLSESRIEEKELKRSLSKVQNRIKSLLETRALITGVSLDISEEKSIPDLLEDILRSRGAKHVDELVEILKTENPEHLSVGKQTVAGALIRYANQGRRFKRVAKNTFDLINEKEKVNV